MPPLDPMVISARCMRLKKTFEKLIADRPWLVNSDRQTDISLALDFEYSRTDHYWTGRSDFALSPRDAWDLLRKSPLTTALCASLSPEMIRLDTPLRSSDSPWLWYLLPACRLPSSKIWLNTCNQAVKF